MSSARSRSWYLRLLPEKVAFHCGRASRSAILGSIRDRGGVTVILGPLVVWLRLFLQADWLRALPVSVHSVHPVVLVLFRVLVFARVFAAGG